MSVLSCVVFVILMFACESIGSYCQLNELLFRGGVRLTINGSHLDLVERPRMNVSLVFSRDGELTHNNTVTVTKLTVSRCFFSSITLALYILTTKMDTLNYGQ